MTYELLEAARWAGYQYDVFDDLDTDRQAQIVAHFRTAARITAVDRWNNRPRAKRQEAP
jgi:hypothetical protein